MLTILFSEIVRLLKLIWLHTITFTPITWALKSRFRKSQRRIVLSLWLNSRMPRRSNDICVSKLQQEIFSKIQNRFSHMQHEQAYIDSHTFVGIITHIHFSMLQANQVSTQSPSAQPRTILMSYFLKPQHAKLTVTFFSPIKLLLLYPRNN